MWVKASLVNMRIKISCDTMVSHFRVLCKEPHFAKVNFERMAGTAVVFSLNTIKIITAVSN